MKTPKIPIFALLDLNRQPLADDLDCSDDVADSFQFAPGAKNIKCNDADEFFKMCERNKAESRQDFAEVVRLPLKTVKSIFFNFFEVKNRRTSSSRSFSHKKC